MAIATAVARRREDLGDLGEGGKRMRRAFASDAPAPSRSCAARDRGDHRCPTGQRATSSPRAAASAQRQYRDGPLCGYDPRNVRAPVAALGLLLVLGGSSCTTDYESFAIGAADGGPSGGGKGGAGATGPSTTGAGTSSSGGASVSPAASTGVGGCAGTVVDCDGDGACETDLDTDPDHCGACDHPCGSDGVAEKHCVGGVCAPVCNPDVLDCKTPPANDPDDGCEKQHDDKHCGGCQIDCTATGHVCISFGAAHVCVCDSDSDCGGMGAKCEPNGSCKCYPGGSPGFHCTYNEPCVGGDDCQCNGGDSCELQYPGFQRVCCPAAAQLCVDLQNDVAHCGGCGVACPAGWSCVAGACTP